MGSLTMAGTAIIIIAVLYLRGIMGRIGLVLAVLAGAALGGVLYPIAQTVFDGASAAAEVASQVGNYATPGSGAKG
jgi:hypothetical protein